MSRRGARGRKALVVGELLLILGWVYLLFQLQPEVAAIQTPTATADAAAIRKTLQGITEQLGIRRLVIAAPQTETALPAPPIELPFAVAPSGDVASQTAVPEVGVYFQQPAQPATAPLGEPFAQTAAVPAETRQPRPASTPSCPYTVTAIIAGNGNPLAVLVDTSGQSRFVSVGETVGAWTVTAIREGEVALAAGIASRALRLQ